MFTYEIFKRAYLALFLALGATVLMTASCHDILVAEEQYQRDAAKKLAEKISYTASFKSGGSSGALYLKRGDDVMHMCSGTLIAPNVVLTAAHCLAYSETVKAMLGNVEYFFKATHLAPQFSSNLEKVVSYTVHPDFDAEKYQPGIPMFDGEQIIETLSSLPKEVTEKCGNLGLDNPEVIGSWLGKKPTVQMLKQEKKFFSCLHRLITEQVGYGLLADKYLMEENDIAVAFLGKEIYGSRPAQLSRADGAAADDKNDFMLLAGYGTAILDDALPLVSGYLHEMPGEVVARNHFEMMLSTQDRAICSGDSGGGALIETADGLHIGGVVIRGSVLPLSGRCSGFSVATDVRPYLPWIESVLQENRGWYIYAPTGYARYKGAAAAGAEGYKSHIPGGRRLPAHAF